MKLKIDFSKTQDKQKLFDVLKQLKPVKYEVELNKWVEKRSLQQNKYYWACVAIVEQETGQDKDDLHEIFKRKFLDKRKVTIKQTGEEIELDGNSSALSTVEFMGYIEKIRVWCLHELDIYLPTPEEFMENF